MWYVAIHGNLCKILHAACCHPWQPVQNVVFSFVTALPHSISVLGSDSTFFLASFIRARPDFKAGADHTDARPDFDAGADHTGASRYFDTGSDHVMRQMPPQ